MQVAPPLNEVPYDEHLSAVETEPPCAALSGLSAIWTLNPGLAPWAVLLDPFGVLGFAPETSLAAVFPKYGRLFSRAPCGTLIDTGSHGSLGMDRLRGDP